jgi:hypothetical protein
MKPAGAFPALLEAFFVDRLMRQRQVSRHTLASYRDTFRLLLEHAQEQLGKVPSALTLADLDAPHMGVIRSRGFVPSFSPFVSDPKSEPSVIRPGLPVLVSTSHTVAARRRSYQYPAYGRAGAQEDETNLSFGLSRPEGGAVVHLDLLGLINPSRLQN